MVTPQKDRSIKKHQKRLSSGAATRIPYPGLSEALRGASGTLLGTSLQLKNYQDSILGEIVPLLGNVKKYYWVRRFRFCDPRFFKSWDKHSNMAQ